MHVAIIMDGNGRWAERRGLRRTAGHEGNNAMFKMLNGARADDAAAAATENNP